MIRTLFLAAASALALAPAAVHAQTADAASCEALARLSLPDLHVTAAAVVGGQDRWSPEPGSPPIAVKAPFCRVQGVIETEIGFELWLPQRAKWNGKFLGTGVGGDAGAFNFRDTPRGVARG